MWKSILLVVVLITLANAQCTCNQFTAESTCFKQPYCLFVDNVCQEQKCENLPYEEKCLAPRCQWSNEKCTTFTTQETSCAALLPQECNSYHGCYYDYTNLICGNTKTCSSLKVAQCNGKSTNGNLCVVDPIANTCVEMKDCSSLTTEFSCESQYPNCVYSKGSCQAPVCNQISDQNSCNYRDDCDWINSKCQKRVCGDTKFGYLCNDSYCGWDSDACFQCVQGYGMILSIALFVLLA